MKRVDRVALVLLVALALVGPSLVRLVGRELEPRLMTTVVWHQAGAGWPDREGPPPERPPGVVDPWGRPFHWESAPATVFLSGTRFVRDHHFAVSHGPALEDPSDDHPVDLHIPSVAPAWKLFVVERPAAAALALVLWLAPAWWILRRRRRRHGLVEAACVVGATAPALGLAWGVAQTEVGHQLARSLPQLVPGTWAVHLSIFGLAFVLALAVRLLSRPPEPA